MSTRRLHWEQGHQGRKLDPKKYCTLRKVFEGSLDRCTNCIYHRIVPTMEMTVDGRCMKEVWEQYAPESDKKAVEILIKIHKL